MSGDAAAAEALPRLLGTAAVDHLAHDIRGSIHVIRGHAELLRAEAAGVEARESASYVFVASVRLGGLCEDLIDFLRLPDIAPGEPVAFALDDLGETLTLLAADRGARLRIVEPDGDRPSMLVHPTVRRVVSHVLDHVVRTAASGVTIAVEIRAPRASCAIAVSPAPIGVVEGDDGVFAVAAEILAAHGGTLTVLGRQIELIFPVVG
jgi:signal transduction histidine kinase